MTTKRPTANSKQYRKQVDCPQPTCGKPVYLTTQGFIPRHNWEPGVECPLSRRHYKLVRTTTSSEETQS